MATTLRSPRVFVLAVVAATLPLVLVLFASETAYAHGELENSSPRANSVLTSAPDRVVIQMTEAPDPVFSEIKVFNKDGERVDAENTRIVGDTSLSVDVESLEPGTYTVAWQVTSVSDAHVTNGTFRFTVGGGGRLFLGTGNILSLDDVDTQPTLSNTTIRWAELLGLAILAGAATTLLLVWWPIMGLVSEATMRQIGRRFRFLALAGLALVAITLVADIIDKTQASTSGESGFFQTMSDILLDSQSGWLFLIRLPVAALLVLLWYRVLKWDGHTKLGVLWIAVGLSAAIALGRSFGSHATAAGDNLLAVSLASDFIHLAAASIWIGGLISLIAGIHILRRTNPEVIGRVVARFSNLAIVSVLAISVTGVYNVWLEVGSLRALTETSYGKVLIVKTSLFVLLLSLAMVNLFALRPGLAKSAHNRLVETAEKLSRRLGLVARGEVTLALIVFLMTALLAHLPLARTAIAHETKASEAPMAMPVLLDDLGLNVTLGVTPNRVGTNTILLELADPLGNPAEQEVEASVQLFRLDQEITTDPFLLEADGPGQLSGRSDALSIVGTWVAKVTIEAGQANPFSVDYVFRVADRPDQDRPIFSGIVDFFTGKEPELPRTGPLIPDGPEAESILTLLQMADDAMNGLKSLHECNNINGVVTVLDFNAPDRMQYSLAGGSESIIAGDQQWYRRGDSPWQLQSRNDQFRFPDFRYAEGATGLRMEGTHLLEGRPHHLVSFYSPRDDADYWFWIDAEQYNIGRLLMNVPPSHYMVSIFDEFDGPRRITSPVETEDATVSAVPETLPCEKYLP